MKKKRFANSCCFSYTNKQYLVIENSKNNLFVGKKQSFAWKNLIVWLEQNSKSKLFFNLLFHKMSQGICTEKVFHRNPISIFKQMMKMKKSLKRTFALFSKFDNSYVKI